MNKVILMGRLTREPDIRYSQSAEGSMAVARYTLAVDRRMARVVNSLKSICIKAQKLSLPDAFKPEVTLIKMVRKSIQLMLL